MGETSVERLYRVNDYIFEIPSAWADTHLRGAKLATGRYRDGGWSGMGPNIFAYGPWLDGSPPASDTIDPLSEQRDSPNGAAGRRWAAARP